MSKEWGKDFNLSSFYACKVPTQFSKITLWWLINYVILFRYYLSWVPWKWSTWDYESIEGSFAYIRQEKSRRPFMAKSRWKGKKVHEFHFRHEIDLHFYFHATWALLEIFDNFDHIFYLTFELFSTPQGWYDPVGPKIWIVNVCN